MGKYSTAPAVYLVKKEIERKNMTFHYPFESESLSQYPYIGRISTGEENSVDFIYQFVKHCRNFINNIDTLNTLHYMYGAPTKFPKYGDFSETFIMRTYDFDISLSSWHASVELPGRGMVWPERHINDINHIEIVYHEAVYPIRVSIYEVYNPGNIIKIWAQDSSNKLHKRWILLWDGSPQIVPPISRLFSPPLQLCNFKTNILKLEFKHSILDYTKLDAVMLIGTSELILPRNPEDSLNGLLKRLNCMYSHHEDVHNLTANYEHAHLDIDHLQKNFPRHCIICKSDIEKSFHKNNFEHKKASVPDYVNRMDESKELPFDSFSVLSDEVILGILKHLDLKTLCLMNQVNKRFNDLTRDPLLYTRLNMRNICCPTYFSNIFRYFTPRCKFLQKLDLTRSDISSFHFVQFIENYGRHLTHLRLVECSSVNNKVLFKISKICKNLKELDLTGCFKIKDQGYLCLENLESLEQLKLGDTYIKARRLCKILQKNKRMRELDLHCTFKGCSFNQVDPFVIELINLCRDLQIINLLEASHITSEGINALADCKNLQEVDLSIYGVEADVNDSLSRLLSSCQLLEKIHLDCHIVLTDRNLILLTECKNLKLLHLEHVKFVTPDNVYIILKQCPKLQAFYLLNHNISPYLIGQWKKSHSHVLRTMIGNFFFGGNDIDDDGYDGSAMTDNDVGSQLAEANRLFERLKTNRESDAVIRCGPTRRESFNIWR
ncbi:F-box/LRR-repeat protein 4-like [Temnothorax longispinosus]|uniref:F-box/LRR-repeat protein 4-like n=1 Tax=Temnothorax longispinosus TaxID=300112 RepID=UPI003A98F813